MDLRGELARIKASTLVISGEQDEATPAAHQKAIAEAIPQARYEVVADAAHIAAVERPETINRLIDTHLV
jgi:pimeloyl-ACP methyl ester carboxylesterase